MKAVVILTGALGLLAPAVDALGITTFSEKGCKGSVVFNYGQSIPQNQCTNTPKLPQSIQIYHNQHFGGGYMQTYHYEACNGDYALHQWSTAAGYNCYDTGTSGIGSFKWGLS